MTGRARDARLVGWYMTLMLGSLPSSALSYRWASTSSTIYVGGPGETTLSEIESHLPNAPLQVVAPRTWFLGANLLLQTGAVLRLHGGAFGDVDELRLKSNNATNLASAVWISADWGALDIQNTTVTSWDEAAQGPDVEYTRYRRAYIRVRSRLDPDGVTPRESWMNIINSEVAYLGYAGSEAYGVSLKVNGTQPGIYERVNVYGRVVHSRLHHNYYGFYCYGAEGMLIANNDVYSNVTYGIDPHDDSDNLRIEGNNAWGNGTHGIIASQRCNNLIVRGNRSFQNRGHGIMLHRSCDQSLVEGNETWGNGACGIAIFDSRDVTVRHNLSLSNLQAGIRLTVGAADCVVATNYVGFNPGHGLYIFRGDDLPRPGDDGRCKHNAYLGNVVERNGGADVRFMDGDDLLMAGNVMASERAELVFEQCRRMKLEGNELWLEATASTFGSAALPGSTVVGYQPHLRVRLDGHSAIRFENPLGQIYQCVDALVPNTVLRGGSQMVIHGATESRGVLVLARELVVRPSWGSAWVRADHWNGVARQWVSTAAASSQRLLYTVGGLQPFVLYGVFRDERGLMTLRANRSGQISFQDTAGTTSDVHYSVRRLW